MTGGFALLLWAGAILCFMAFFVEKITSDNPAKDYVSTYINK